VRNKKLSEDQEVIKVRHLGAKPKNGRVKAAEYMRGEGVWGLGEIIRERCACNAFGFGQKNLTRTCPLLERLFFFFFKLVFLCSFVTESELKSNCLSTAFCVACEVILRCTKLIII